MKKDKSYMTQLLILASIMLSCSNDNSELHDRNMSNQSIQQVKLPIRNASRPETTLGVPHVQIDVELVPVVHEELIKRIYAIPGIEDRASVIASWRALWLTDSMSIIEPNAILGGREFGHIHHDGSLHIFLEPDQADEAVETGWAVHHPYALENRDGWDGFVMLYTPQTFEELNVTFQLIVDAYNNVTGQNLLATDFY